MPNRILADCLSHRAPLALQTSINVLEAAKVMTRNHCGSVLVIDAQNDLVGIFTERDLLNKVVSKGLDTTKTTIGEVMTADPRTAHKSMPTSHALILMRDGGFRHIPVLDDNGAILGVFSIRDALTSELIDADRITEQQEIISALL